VKKKEFSFILNQQAVTVFTHPKEIVLDLLREKFNLSGVKSGCREGDCGACSILFGLPQADHVEYRVVCSCLLPVGEIHKTHLVTIEGLNDSELNPLQKAIVESGATQCGFCTPGIVVALTGYFLQAEIFNIKEAIAAIAGNICRCTGYISLRRAIESIFSNLPSADQQNRLEKLIAQKIIPAYFRQIPALLKEIHPQAPLSARISNPLYIAGGTDLLVNPSEQLTKRELVFLSNLPELQNISLRAESLQIGAAVTVEELRTNKLVAHNFPGLAESLLLVSSQQIRNRATIAGNIVNASPIGDLTIILLALGANLNLRKGNQQRQLRLDDFFHGYKKTKLQPQEIIQHIIVPLFSPNMHFSFEKVSRRHHLDIASVNSALLISVKDKKIDLARLSAGGVAPVPLLLKKSSAFLEGEKLSLSLLQKTAELISSEISPISDIRGSAKYKQSLLKRLFFAHFRKLFPEYFSEESIFRLLKTENLRKNQ